jgi:hypothetical protein
MVKPSSHEYKGKQSGTYFLSFDGEPFQDDSRNWRRPCGFTTMPGPAGVSVPGFIVIHRYHDIAVETVRDAEPGQFYALTYGKMDKAGVWGLAVPLQCPCSA